MKMKTSQNTKKEQNLYMTLKLYKHFQRILEYFLSKGSSKLHDSVVKLEKLKKESLPLAPFLSHSVRTRINLEKTATAPAFGVKNLYTECRS